MPVTIELNYHTGIGLTAKSAEAGGISLIIIYNSGRFRMNGRGSLAGLMPYSNANDVVVDMGSDVLPVVKHTPVIAGVCASDPGRDMGRFLRQLKDLGFAGVQNFPTVGLIDGNFRQNLEETGMGYDTEVEMVRIGQTRSGRSTRNVLPARSWPLRGEVPSTRSRVCLGTFATMFSTTRR
jgi:predicted TIM-barrel enzyme